MILLAPYDTRDF